MDITSIVYPIVSIGGLGILFGAGLGYASKKFAVEVDERIPRLEIYFLVLIVEVVAMQAAMLLLRQ